MPPKAPATGANRWPECGLGREGRSTHAFIANVLEFEEGQHRVGVWRVVGDVCRRAVARVGAGEGGCYHRATLVVAVVQSVEKQMNGRHRSSNTNMVVALGHRLGLKVGASQAELGTNAR